MALPRSLGCQVLSVVLALASLGQSSDVRAQSADTPHAGRRSLDITYSDGRLSRTVLKPRGGMWTPRFPRRSAPPPHRGLPLSALKVDYETRDQVVTVRVSLLYGSPHQADVAVATVSLRDNVPVAVRELESFGVDPIMLALGDVAPSIAPIPSVRSASSSLEITIDAPEPDMPDYIVSVRNLSDRPVRAIAYKGYSNGREVASGRQKDGHANPILSAMGTAQFRVRPRTGDRPGGDWAPNGIDHLELTGVLWEDGLVEGDPELSDSERALALGHARQLARVLALLRRQLATMPAPSSSAADRLRAAVDELAIQATEADVSLLQSRLDAETKPTSDRLRFSLEIGSQQVKSEVLAELKKLGDGDVGRWVLDVIPRYEAWLARAESAVR